MDDPVEALKQAEMMTRDSGRLHCIVDDGYPKVRVMPIRLARRTNRKILEVARYQPSSVVRYIPIKFTKSTQDQGCTDSV